MSREVMIPLSATCECGCGLEVSLYQTTSKSRGQVKGAPARFVRGHNNKLRERKSRIDPRRYTDRTNPEYNEYHRQYYYKYAYGLSYEEVVEMKSKGCQICGSMERPVIDHCHVSNEVRGVLCSDCNSALGLFKDNPTSLTRAIEYLAEGRYAAN